VTSPLSLNPFIYLRYDVIRSTTADLCFINDFYFAPGRSSKYCDEYVSLFVCLSVRITQQEGLAVASIARDVVL